MLAGGQGKTDKERRLAEAKSLAAAQETWTVAVHKTVRTLAEWKSKRAGDTQKTANTPGGEDILQWL